jgi:YHS domain-containing protein
MKRLVSALCLVVLASGLSFAQDDLPKVGAADAASLEKLNQAGAVAMALASNTNLVSVNFSMAGPKVADAQLELLKPVTEQTFWLNLAGTGVTDAGLAQIAGLKNLQRLHLEKTAITDAGLAHLKGLAELRYLNLYGTKVTDKGLESLRGLKKLRNLYVWQTAVTEEGAKALAGTVTGIDINRGVEAPPPPPKPVEQPKAPAAKAINAKCPISGKDVDPAAISVFKNQAIGFCCMNCKAKCPRNDMDVVAGITLEHKGVLIAFCSEDCKTAFPTDPEKYINRYPHFKEAYDKAVKDAAKPAEKPKAAPDKAKAINTKCPLSGKDVDAAASVTFKAQVIAFCCNNCKGKFEAEPAKYIAKVAEFKDPDKK